MSVELRGSEEDGQSDRRIDCSTGTAPIRERQSQTVTLTVPATDSATEIDDAHKSGADGDLSGLGGGEVHSGPVTVHSEVRIAQLSDSEGDDGAKLNVTVRAEADRRVKKFE